jgi:pimeloyl-ACP methyl ester carboxylesterase
LLLDHSTLSARYFFPRQEPLPGAVQVLGPGFELACARRGSDPARLTVIHFHGNGEIVAEAQEGLGPDLEAMGCNAFFAEYRGYGDSTGQPALVAMLEDVERVFAAVDAPEERVVAYGRSLGSVYAIELAARHPRLAGLVVESGIADLLERVLLRVRPEELGGTQAELEAEVARHLDHRAKLAAYPGRLLVLHAADDEVIDPSHAERNLAWSAAEEKERVLLPRGGHNGLHLFSRTEYLGALGAFLGRCGAQR